MQAILIPLSLFQIPALLFFLEIFLISFKIKKRADNFLKNIIWYCWKHYTPCTCHFYVEVKEKDIKETY